MFGRIVGGAQPVCAGTGFRFCLRSAKFCYEGNSENPRSLAASRSRLSVATNWVWPLGNRAWRGRKWPSNSCSQLPRSSSRICSTVTPILPVANRWRNPANSVTQACRSAGALGWGREVSGATGRPWLVMITSSPRWTMPTKLGRSACVCSNVAVILRLKQLLRKSQFATSPQSALVSAKKRAAPNHFLPTSELGRLAIRCRRAILFHSARSR